MLSSLREAVGRASDVRAIVDNAFEEGCISLLTEAYRRLKHAGGYQLQWHENMFTARLVIYMEEVRDDEDINIHIDPECYQYFKEVLSGKDDPNRAARIDIRLKGGWARRDVYYAMEAKILVENNWSTRKAAKLQKRYIETGIDHFVKGTYSPIILKGCLIGYIVEGQPLRIQSAINKSLASSNRTTEILQNQRTINDYHFCFSSNHIRVTDHQRLQLYHIMLVFT